MSAQEAHPLLVGEVSVDVTITPRGEPNKLRFGGIVHAARGFWSAGISFSAAVILPKYVEQSAKAYLKEFGCQNFIVLGYVSGAPNVTLIFDQAEVDDQEYDTLLRDAKHIELVENVDAQQFASFTDALVIPGSYDLKTVCSLLSSAVQLHIDVAYDVASVDQLQGLQRSIATIFISTSSALFKSIGANLDVVCEYFRAIKPQAVILKENRGGSRLRIYSTGETVSIPAQLAQITVNSVGVGDFFDAIYVSLRDQALEERALRASFASSAYAQSTYPDRYGEYVRRDFALSRSELEGLGGVSLPWEDRQKIQIYLAAPDFRDTDTHEIERATSALRYHNFTVRRPVKEIGELRKDTDISELRRVYDEDYELLRRCQLVFAIPLDRDPGTLVEIGLASEMGIPVVVYDPNRVASNTMVMAGCRAYSSSLGECLNATFVALRRK